MQKSMLAAAFLLPLLVLIPVSAYAQSAVPILPAVQPVGIAMSHDGMTMYVAGPGAVTRFTLSTPFDITSVGDGTMQSFLTRTDNVQGVTISNDTTRMFLASNGGTENNVVQIPIGADRAISTPSSSPDCCGGGNLDVAISRNGDWLFLGRSGQVDSFQLGTPFDISGTVTPRTTHDTSETADGLAISNDGMRLFTFSGNAVRQYDLDTAFTLVDSVTQSADDTFLAPSIAGSAVTARGMDFSNDGMVMYLLDTNGGDRVIQYPLTAAFTLPTIATITANSAGNLANGTSTAQPAIRFTVTFNEDVMGFEEKDITLTGTANNNNPQIIPGSFTPDPDDASLYTFQVAVGSSIGTVTVSIGANAAKSTSDSTGSSKVIPFAVAFTSLDTRPPIVTISSTDVPDGGTAQDVVNFTATFNRPVMDGTFTANDITAVGDGATHTVTNVERMSDLMYTFQVDHSGEDQNINVSIAAGMFADLEGTTNPVPSNTYTYDFAILPTVVSITASDGSGNLANGTSADTDTISFTATFSEPVSGLLATEITVESTAPDAGTHKASNLSPDTGSATVFTFDVARNNTGGTINVSIPDGAAADIDDNGNTASAVFTATFDVPEPDPPSLDYFQLPSIPDTYTASVDVEFSGDGMRLFVLQSAGSDNILQYDLGTAFDISTRASSPSIEYAVGGLDSQPSGIEFSDNGMKLFVIGTSADRIHELLLTSAYQLVGQASATDSSIDAFPDMPPNLPDTLPTGLEFSRDGTRMYVTGTGADRIYGYTLGTGFDLSSISQPVATSPQLSDDNPTGSAVNDDGSILYVMGAQNIGGTRNLYAYSMNPAYDASSLVLISGPQPLFHSILIQPTEIEFTSDFMTLHVTGNDPSGRIYRFVENTAPPVLGALSIEVAEDEDVSIQIPGSDVDGAALEYRITDNPSWLTINSTGHLSGTVPQDNTGLYRAEDTPARCSTDGSVSFTVMASDDGFDSDGTDNTARTYTVDIMNNERSPNAPPMAIIMPVLVATNARELDLAMHTSDADTADTLTYSNIRSDVNAAIVASSLQITPEGLATFMTTGAGGVANISYDVCDGSILETLMVSTQSAPPALEIIPDQSINEGQTLDSLDLYIISHTESPLFNVTEITIAGDLVPIFASNGSLTTEEFDMLMPGDPDLNGTAPGGGSLTAGDQRAWQISSTEALNFMDNADQIDARFLELFQQEADGVPPDEQIDPFEIIHTIPVDFVDANLERSPPVRIDYTFVLEDGTSHQAIFDLVVNRTDAAPISSLPAQYVFNPSDPDMVIDLADHFTDPEGDTITYNMTSDSLSESVVITLDANVLTINPESPGLTLLTLCAESDGGGGSVPNGSTCDGIAVFVRGADTIQSRIFQESSITVRHTDTAATIVLNGNNTIIDPTVLFDHIIITANDAAATGSIRINSTGTIHVLDLRLPDRAIIDKTLTLSNNSGTISYNPSSDAASPVDTITFNAVLYNPAVQDTRTAPRDNSTVTSQIVPRLHDTLTVNYEFVTDDLSPVKLVSNGMPFGPRHASDYFALAVHDLFEDPDNSRPGPLDVTIAGQSNTGLTAVVGDDPDAEFSGSILGNFVVIRPPGPNHNGQTNFNFIVDDGTSTPLETSILFRFETDDSGTVPVDFPQSPISRFFLDRDFEPFVIDFEDLIAGGNATFVEAISITNLRLPDDSSIGVSEFNATHHRVTGTSNFESETMMLDVVRQDDASVTLFENYRVAFSTDSPPPQASSGGGDDDTQWKTKPTFGKSYTTGQKIVDCGYSMDNVCRDVTDYHVDYKRNTIETDSLHDFALKAYAQNGLRSFNIGFGLPGVGSPLNAAEAQINVNLIRDYSINSTYRIDSVEYSNENRVIGEDATFEISRVQCLPADNNELCVRLSIDGVLFRETLYDEPFAINALDSKRRGTTHYMNEGLLVFGDSLNAPPTHELSERHSNQGDAVKLHLTRTDKLADVWTDQLGHQWTKNAFGTWSYVEGPKIVVSPICDDPDKRVCNAFAQKLAAYNVQMENLRDSLYDKAYTMPAFDDLHETVTIYDIDGDSRERFLADNDLLWLLE